MNSNILQSLLLPLGFAAGWLLHALWLWRSEPAPETGEQPGDPSADDRAHSPRGILAIAAALEGAYDASSHPCDLLDEPDFQEGVARLCSDEFSIEQLATYCCGANRELAPIAAEALACRADSAPAIERVLQHCRRARVWTIYYALRFFDARSDRPVVGAVLACADDWWAENPILPTMLSQFAERRAAGGEVINLGAALDQLPHDGLASVRALLRELDGAQAALLRDQFAEWRLTRVNHTFLDSVGRVRRHDATETNLVVVDTQARLAEAAAETLLQTPPRSLVLVGESGVGKSTIVRLLQDAMAAKGWTLFEASALDVNAGMTYTGELEGRIRQLTDELDARRKVIWYVPNFHEMLYFGRHKLSPIGILDMLLPAIESGRLCLIGETQPAALERIVQQRPRVRGAFASLNLEPMTATQALSLGQDWLAAEIDRTGLVGSPGVVTEALDLSRQYLSSRALPGSLLDLLGATRDRLLKANASRQLNRESLFETLTELTGLPRSVLDEDSGLDAVALSAHFATRVMGQPEAVDALVGRIAMLKAGLTDPNRPIGVFLFAGPTGTGKTEVAKTLAEFLFGHGDRMIRLDMSEFHEPSSLPRIFGEPGEQSDANALVNRIRKQPFSVVLLDEFEKAHPRIWDLFLQVFDDGRLSDAQGALADFRHSIIILTSNLGATAHQGSSLGFTDSASPFNAGQVMRAINQTFRPEFVNRLDRIVVFRPLARAVMREILQKELKNVLLRRGFRNREWAVEWEESAIEFLLDRGFTPDMGARPLRRAIEQYVLAPIAMTIVERRHPEGDQFLFVRSDGAGVQVEFVDPDSDAAAGDNPVQPMTPAPMAAEVERLADHIAASPWQSHKATQYQLLNAPGFWERADRFVTLDQIERIDRIEAGIATSQSLLQRLEGRNAKAAIAASLREQIHLLRAAIQDLEGGRPGDAYLMVEPVADDATPNEAAAWAERILGMYTRWAQARRMRQQTLSDRGLSAVFAISGLGAYWLLEREAGLHVFEVGDDERTSSRYTARVQVAPQPVLPRSVQQSEIARARGALATHPAPNSIIRRYRERPSPLVRDAVAGWRSGKLNHVLAGNFDLIGYED